MLYTVSNALSFQGFTLLVGYLFGAVAVAIFNTYRTLARVTVQLTSLLSYSIWPESRASMAKVRSRSPRSIYRRSVALGLVLAFGLSIAIYILAPWLLRIWNDGAIDFQPMPVMILLVYAAVGGVWHVPRVLLMATNRHGRLAQWTLGTSVIALLLSVVMGQAFELSGVAIAMLIGEATMAIVCIYLDKRFLILASTTS